MKCFTSNWRDIFFSVVKQCFVLYPKQWNQLPPCIVLPEAIVSALLLLVTGSLI